MIRAADLHLTVALVAKDLDSYVTSVSTPYFPSAVRPIYASGFEAKTVLLATSMGLTSGSLPAYLGDIND